MISKDRLGFVLQKVADTLYKEGLDCFALHANYITKDGQSVTVNSFSKLPDIPNEYFREFLEESARQTEIHIVENV